MLELVSSLKPPCVVLKLFLTGLVFVSDLDNRELASWRSLELIDTLIVLAEGGHSQTVKELFAVPQAHCPGTYTVKLRIPVASCIHIPTKFKFNCNLTVI